VILCGMVHSFTRCGAGRRHPASFLPSRSRLAKFDNQRLVHAARSGAQCFIPDLLVG
jgi:hypothetical protein